MTMPPPGERLARLREAIDIVRAACSAAARSRSTASYHRRVDARDRPAARVQQPRPPIFVGGKGDRLLALVAELRRRLEHVLGLDARRVPRAPRACSSARATRSAAIPATVRRSLGLYALCGEDEADLARRFERLRALSPPGVLDGMTLDEWREGRLVGTVEQVREQARDVGGARRRDPHRGRRARSRSR